MIAAHPASLTRRHEALDADLQHELKRPLPDFMRIKRLKQLKLRLKDRLVAQLDQPPNRRA
jgi:hypothetical protein